jgi:predicted ATP-grasp superfamily ATP-dependent carboligase
MSVLVTHAHNRLAYYTTRILAKHDIKVTCASEFPLATCYFSRYSTDHFTYPSPWKQPEQFVEKIIEEIERRDIEVLMPVHREGYVLSKYKEELDYIVNFPYSPYPDVVSVNDKRDYIETAARAGLKTPRTIAPNSLNHLKEMAPILQYPAVIKLPRSHGRIGMSTVKDPTDLIDTYAKTLHRFRISAKDEHPIVQEYVRGTDIDIQMLFNHGKLRAKFSMLFPRYFYRFEYENKEATESLLRLGKHLKWHGVISGTPIIEEDTGVAYLVDVNPRFSGALGFANMCGVELPYLLYRMAIEGDIESVLDYRRGLESRYFWGEMCDAFKSINRGEWKQASDILTCKAPLDYWDKTDPLPFFTIPAYTLTQLIRTGKLQPLVEKY